ncbi:hypothetical protein [Comamonas jiangduensis]|uniref:hypothetical protein n=1 Tax=Comamonas jiangduensis TaxID=1194168 RepID=UPI003BF8F62E
MSLRSIFLGLLISAATSYASAAANYAACLLETLPGTQSQAAFAAGMQMCSDKHKDRLFVIKRGDGRGLFAYKSPNACTVEKAKTTSWQPAAHQIRLACECLYGESRGEWDMCQRYTLPAGIREQHENLKTIASQIELEHHYRRIYAQHPDADEIFNRRDFQEWWLKDPAKAKVLTNGTTRQIIHLISTFKDELSASSPTWGAGDTPAPSGYR